MDSGCSRHMTGDPSRFSSLSTIKGGNVTFGDNSKGKIIGIGNIGGNSLPLIENVLLVDKLKHNLLSISQLCDKGYRVVFESSRCLIENVIDGKLLFIGDRNSNVYKIDIDQNACVDNCLVVNVNDSWLWHRRMGHVSMHQILKISKHDLVNGLPKLNFEKDQVCEACQMGKQVKTSFKSKNFISTSRPLQLLHLDLFGPSRIQSLGGKSYAFVIVDDYSRFTWILFLT